ncbi:MAG: Wzz/FepE/Etk N-terminal domain-containing protein [Sphingomonadaceae bacterium]
MTPLDLDDYASQSPSGDGVGGMLANVGNILRQRKWLVIIPAVLTALAALAAAFLLPATYRSKAVLLVESAQLQTDGNGQIRNDIIDERVAKVRQQVLSRPDLIAIAQELQLYPNKRTTSSLGEIVEDMRKAITIEPVSAQIQQRSGSRNQTVAFSMSFDYDDRYAAQAVTQKLVERVLEVDSSRTAEQASDNVRFLTEEANAIRGRMSVVEQQMTAIKARYGQVLSSQGLTMMGGSTGGLDAQIAALERENSQLRAQRTAAQGGASRDPMVMQAEATLAALRATYTDGHPDVLLARQRLAEAKELAKRNISNLPFDTVASQIETNNGQIAILRAARAREAAQMSSVISAQARAPMIQEQVAQLQQQLQGLNDQFQETSKRLDTAKTNLRIENEQRGERLTVVDPPVVEDEPVWPDRWLVIGGGLGGGLLLGLMLAFLAEMLLQPVRGPFAAASAAGGGELLGAIPTIVRRGGPSGRSQFWNPLTWRRRSSAMEA